MFKIMNDMTPVYLKEIFSRNVGCSVYNLRTLRWDLALPAPRTGFYRNSFAYTGAKLWNALSNDMECIKSIRGFKNRLEDLSVSIET